MSNFKKTCILNRENFDDKISSCDLEFGFTTIKTQSRHSLSYWLHRVFIDGGWYIVLFRLGPVSRLSHFAMICKS